VIRPNKTLAIQNADGTFQDLTPWQPHRFRIKEFADVVYEFRIEGGRVVELKQTNPSGEYRSKRTQ